MSRRPLELVPSAPFYTTPEGVAMNDIESRLLDMLTDLLLNATKRVLALEALLKERGLFSEEEIAVKAQAIDDAAILEREYGADHAEFRQVRTALKEMLREKNGENPSK
jgi:hypothetical protein